MAIAALILGCLFVTGVIMTLFVDILRALAAMQNETTLRVNLLTRALPLAAGLFLMFWALIA